MANEFGNDWRVAIKSGAGFIPIGGETSLDWKRSSQEQDISDKDSGVYGATSYGQQKITFAVAGNLKLPDAGFAAAEAASKSSPTEPKSSRMSLTFSSTRATKARSASSSLAKW